MTEIKASCFYSLSIADDFSMDEGRASSLKPSAEYSHFELMKKEYESQWGKVKNSIRDIFSERFGIGRSSYPFLELKKIVDSLDPCESVDENVRAFEQTLFALRREDVHRAQALGLYDAATFQRIVQDVREFLHKPPLLTCKNTSRYGDVEYQPLLHDLIRETRKERIGSVVQKFFLDRNPTMVLTCTRQERDSYSVAITHVFRCLSQEMKESLREKLAAVTIGEQKKEIIDRIIFGYEMEWQNFVRKSLVGLYIQTHGIPGLKVYADKEGRLIADVAGSRIGSGGYKSAKKICQILSDGSAVFRARYKPLKGVELEGASVESAAQNFGRDIVNHMRCIQKIGESSGLLIIEKRGEYIGKSGKKKTRYETDLFEGSLFEFLTRNPLCDEKISLYLFLGACKGLLRLHEKGVVHGDITLRNIFVKEKIGVLADLGMSRDCGAPYSPHMCVPCFRPPESPATDSLARDMFAMGICLLFIVRNDIYKQVESLQARIHERYTRASLKVSHAVPLPSDEFKSEWEAICCALKQSQRDVEHLAADLLSFDPEKRPACREVLRRVSDCLDHCV